MFEFFQIIISDLAHGKSLKNLNCHVTDSDSGKQIVVVESHTTYS